MVKLLTKKEFSNAEKEINNFLLSLDFNIKSSLFNLFSPIVEKMNCEHEWKNTDSYENDFDKNTKICKKCLWLKNK